MPKQKIISIFLTVLLIPLFSILFFNTIYASTNDNRWQWIISSDTVGWYFDKQTIFFEKSPLEKQNKNMVIVPIKSMFTWQGVQNYIDSVKDKNLFTENEFEKLTELSFLITIYKFDIENKKECILAHIFYDKNGNLIKQIDYKEQYNFYGESWNLIIPETYQEFIFSTIKKYAKDNLYKLSTIM